MPQQSKFDYPPAVRWNERRNFKVGTHWRCKVPVCCPTCRQVREVDYRQLNPAMRKGTFTGRCRSCNGHLRGKANPHWKGGRHAKQSGGGIYIYQMVDPDHQFACMAGRNGIPEHRLRMAESLGRPLTTLEHVHHRDGNALNNELSNLQIVTPSEHTRIHAPEMHRMRAQDRQSE